MARRRGGAAPVVIVLAALLVAGGYSAFAANGAGQDLQHGRDELTAAQAALTAGQRSPDEAAIRRAISQLQDAERDFARARQRIEADPALRMLGTLPASSTQVEAAARLGAIGVDLSRAGQSAAAIALRLAALEQQDRGTLTTADLQGLVQQAAAIATSYQGSIASIGAELNAAHAERAQVTTTGLLPPLRHAYDEVDRDLDQADSAFLRYQDVKQLLADFLGVAVSG